VDENERMDGRENLSGNFCQIGPQNFHLVELGDENWIVENEILVLPPTAFVIPAFPGKTI
jgi:hypothetical protein